MQIVKTMCEGRTEARYGTERLKAATYERCNYFLVWCFQTAHRISWCHFTPFLQITSSVFTFNGHVWRGTSLWISPNVNVSALFCAWKSISFERSSHLCWILLFHSVSARSHIPGCKFYTHIKWKLTLTVVSHAEMRRLCFNGAWLEHWMSAKLVDFSIGREHSENNSVELRWPRLRIRLNRPELLVFTHSEWIGGNFYSSALVCFRSRMRVISQKLEFFFLNILGMYSNVHYSRAFVIILYLLTFTRVSNSVRKDYPHRTTNKWQLAFKQYSLPPSFLSVISSIDAGKTTALLEWLAKTSIKFNLIN